MKGRRVCSQPHRDQTPGTVAYETHTGFLVKVGHRQHRLEKLSADECPSRLGNVHRPDELVQLIKIVDRSGRNAQVRGQLGSRHQRIVNEPKHR